jgi:hypothetical protein
LRVAERSMRRSFNALPPAILAILQEGGLIPFLHKYPDWEIPA